MPGISVVAAGFFDQRASDVAIAVRLSTRWKFAYTGSFQTPNFWGRRLLGSTSALDKAFPRDTSINLFLRDCDFMQGLRRQGRALVASFFMGLLKNLSKCCP